jgi:lysyl-tRNA synthetase class 2
VARIELIERREEMVRSARAFFDARGFVHVETPALVPCPGLDVHLDAFETNARSAAKYLITSPEYQMKRLLSAGMPRIYQITRAFRRGEVGSRHNPEFTILEFYRANASADDVMKDTEQLVARLTGGRVTLAQTQTQTQTQAQMQAHSVTRTISTTPPFTRMTVAEAYEKFANVSRDEMLRLAENDEDTFYRLLVDTVEPALAALDHAVFITEYPTTQASLARRKPGDPRVAERFELYVAGVELCNGFGELTDPKEQRARFLHDQDERRTRGLPVYPIDEKFLEALERGMPESGGNAIGLDRLVALACGTTDIAEVIAFTDATV